MRGVLKHLQLLRLATLHRCSYSGNSSLLSSQYVSTDTESLLKLCHQRDLPRAMHVLDAMERRRV